jgi:hypothetical protein
MSVDGFNLTASKNYRACLGAASLLSQEGHAPLSGRASGHDPTAKLLLKLGSRAARTRIVVMFLEIIVATHLDGVWGGEVAGRVRLAARMWVYNRYNSVCGAPTGMTSRPGWKIAATDQCSKTLNVPDAGFETHRMPQCEDKKKRQVSNDAQN